MKIKWLGHSCFLITSESGIRIITDPYQPGGNIMYHPIDEAADIVTMSHDQHTDHNYVAGVKGSPRVVRGTAEAGGISFRGIPTAHDEAGGRQRGTNTVFCFEVDGVSVCHAGDLGHVLSEKQVNEVGEVDVLLLPVGGFFTIDAKAASRVCDQLKPAVVIPMHYKNEKLNFPIVGVDDFLRGKSNVKRADTSEVELKAGELPAPTQIIVLQPAR